MTTAQATAPGKSAPRGPRFRVATFGITLAVLLAAIVWHNVSLHREMSSLKDQLKPEQQKQAEMAVVKVSYDELQHELQEYEQTVNVIDGVTHTKQDPVPVMHALDPVLGNRPDVSVASIEPISGRDSFDVNIEVTAAKLEQAEKFRDAVEATGNFKCDKKLSGYAPGTLSFYCRFLAPAGGER